MKKVLTLFMKIGITLLLLSQMAVANANQTVSSLTLKHLSCPRYFDALLAKKIFMHPQFAKDRDAHTRAREIITANYGSKKIVKFDRLLDQYERGHSDLFELLRRKTFSIMEARPDSIIEFSDEYSLYEQRVQNDAVVLLLDNGEIGYASLVKSPSLLALFERVTNGITFTDGLASQKAQNTVQLLKEFRFVDDKDVTSLRKEILEEGVLDLSFYSVQERGIRETLDVYEEYEFSVEIGPYLEKRIGETLGAYKKQHQRRLTRINEDLNIWGASTNENHPDLPPSDE